MSNPILCMNPTCPNPIPDGWEGGYCPVCSDMMDRDFEKYLNEIETFLDNEAAEHDRSDSLREPPINPYEEYGFDYPYEK